MRRPWIKIETCTPDKPEVCSLATHLKMDEDMVVGKLVRLWSWAELNRIDPNDLGVTKEFIDKLVGRKGFAQALELTGWLIETNGKLSFRNFKRHNSPVAQNKALTAKRVARHRFRKAEGNEKVTEKALTKKTVKAPKLEKIPTPIDHDNKVIKPDNSLVITEILNEQLEPIITENVTITVEPVMETLASVEESELPPPTVVEDAHVVAPAEEKITATVEPPDESPPAMEEAEQPHPGVIEEAPTVVPVQETAPRKRRGKAAAESQDQPLLF